MQHGIASIVLPASKIPEVDFPKAENITHQNNKPNKKQRGMVEAIRLNIAVPVKLKSPTQF